MHTSCQLSRISPPHNFFTSNVCYYRSVCGHLALIFFLHQTQGLRIRSRLASFSISHGWLWLPASPARPIKSRDQTVEIGVPK
jgi:hypothetical protein